MRSSLFWRFICASCILNLALLVDGACYKLSTCAECLAETFDDGSCLWYRTDENANGVCISGNVQSAETLTDSVEAAEFYATWTTTLDDGQQSSFITWGIDQSSDDACYNTACEYMGQCALGFYAVSNEPCYSDTVYPDWRTLRCCRQQRNMDGYLRGFDSWKGELEGEMWYAACCAACYPGNVNVGCDAYDPGECEECPDGTFNPYTEAGSTCTNCQPCEAGYYRYRCGPSTEGTCKACSEGYYKKDGLEGSYTDTCQECAECTEGLVRTGCGGSSPGTCVRCDAGEFFATPVCKACAPCVTESKNKQARFGCGGLSEGVCSECTAGFYQDVGSACQSCKTCTEDLSSLVNLSRLELDFSTASASSSVRLGCGSLVPGRCGQLGLLLDGSTATACPTDSLPKAYCQQSMMTVKWVLAGIPQDLLADPYLECTAETQLCLAGMWKATLRKRSSPVASSQDATVEEEGTLVAELGTWYAWELSGTWEVDDGSEASHYFAQKAMKLPAGLEEGTGYFVRIAFTDVGGSCCGAPDELPLYADTAHFALVSSLHSLEEALNRAPELALSGNADGAVELLEDSCAEGQNLGLAQDVLTTSACELSRIYRLILPVGTTARLSQQLRSDAASQPDAAVREATLPVARARNLYSTAESLRSKLASSLPSDLGAWQTLVASAAGEDVKSGSTYSSTAASHVPLASSVGSDSPFYSLLTVALDYADFANSTLQAWEDDSGQVYSELEAMLDDLKTLDSELSSSTEEAGFNVVRLAQAVTYNLRVLGDEGPPTDSDEREDWFDSSFQTIMAAAFLQLGSWTESWRNSFHWETAATVGDLQWPPPSSSDDDEDTEAFGGAVLDSEAVDLALSRGRVWSKFRTAAESVLRLWEKEERRLRRLQDGSEDAEDTTTTVATTVASSTSASSEETTSIVDEGSSSPATTATNADTETTRTAELTAQSALAAQILDRVERMTEDVLAKLERGGSKLLDGSFPSMDGCDHIWRLCLTNLVEDSVLEDTLITEAWYGFGERNIRPWLLENDEIERLTRASREVVRLAKARARLFEDIFIRTADLREILAEQEVVALALNRALTATAHVAAAAVAASGDAASVGTRSGPDQAWRLLDLRLLLERSNRTLSGSAARLGRRRLTALEELATWIGAPAWGVDATPWRITFVPGRDESARLTTALTAANEELDRGLTELLAQPNEVGTGLLRIEAGPSKLPVLWANLFETGRALVHLSPPDGNLPLHMHGEAYAFFLSSDEYVYPLEPADSEAEFSEDAISTTVPHVELRLRCLLGGPAGVPARKDAQESLYTTRHTRKLCDQLWNSGVNSVTGDGIGALWPLGEVWLLETLDGPTQSLLSIEEVTSIRLLFKVDVPKSMAPWNILDDDADLLYELPETESCNDLMTIYGNTLNSTTTTDFHNFNTTTATATTTTATLDDDDRFVYVGPDGEELDEPYTASTTTKDVATDGFVGGSGSSASSEGEGSDGFFLWAWADGRPAWFVATVLVFVGLFCCAGVVSCTWCYVRQRRRRRRARVASLNNSEDGNVKEEPPSEKAKAAGMPKKPPSQLAPEVAKNKDLPRLSARNSPWSARSGGEWDITDTPRKEGHDDDTPDAEKHGDDDDHDDGDSSSSSSSSSSGSCVSEASDVANASRAAVAVARKSVSSSTGQNNDANNLFDSSTCDSRLRSLAGSGGDSSAAAAAAPTIAAAAAAAAAAVAVAAAAQNEALSSSIAQATQIPRMVPKRPPSRRPRSAKRGPGHSKDDDNEAGSEGARSWEDGATPPRTASSSGSDDSGSSRSSLSTARESINGDDAPVEIHSEIPFGGIQTITSPQKKVQHMEGPAPMPPEPSAEATVTVTVETARATATATTSRLERKLTPGEAALETLEQNLSEHSPLAVEELRPARLPLAPTAEFSAAPPASPTSSMVEHGPIADNPDTKTTAANTATTATLAAAAAAATDAVARSSVAVAAGPVLPMRAVSGLSSVYGDDSEDLDDGGDIGNGFGGTVKECPPSPSSSQSDPDLVT